MSETVTSCATEKFPASELGYLFSSLGLLCSFFTTLVGHPAVRTSGNISGFTAKVLLRI